MTKVIDFYADWCGPCKEQSNVLDQMNFDKLDATLEKVDVDESPDMAEEYSVQAIPTLLVVKEGEVTARFTGVTPAEEIRNAVK